MNLTKDMEGLNVTLNASTIKEFIESEAYDNMVKYSDWRSAEQLRSILLEYFLKDDSKKKSRSRAKQTVNH